MKPQNLLNLVFTFSIALLIILSFVSYNRTQEIERYSYSVDHTYNVMLESERLFSSVKGTISSQRGFLLTKDSAFYESFITEERSMNASLKTLKALVNDNPVQVAKVDSLEALLKKRSEELHLSIANNYLPVKNALYLKNLILYGRQVSVKIQSLVGEIIKEEKKLMEVRLDAREKNQKVTPNFLIITSALAMIFLGTTFYALNKELKKRLSSQNELELKINELNRSNAELEQFAYVASHDLQEPLRKIRAFSDRLTMKHGASLLEDGKMMLEKIQSSAERMQKLIDDLLNFSRLVKNLDDVDEVDLNILLKNLVNDMSETIKSKNVVINISPLPVITAYTNQMYQLFQNLISNAIKFSKEGEGALININYKLVKGNEIKGIENINQQKEYHKISVADNGIGFDQQFSDKIFIIFQRLHGKLEYGGTGIGLAICKRITANHHGYISAKSKLNEGATFYIYLPVGNFRDDNI